MDSTDRTEEGTMIWVPATHPNRTVLTDMAQLIAFLAAHSELPMPEWPVVYAHIRGTDADQTATIEAAARIMETAVTHSHGHHSTIRQFGKATYEVVGIDQAEKDRHEALMSYYRQVSP